MSRFGLLHLRSQIHQKHDTNNLRMPPFSLVYVHSDDLGSLDKSSDPVKQCGCSSARRQFPMNAIFLSLAMRSVFTQPRDPVLLLSPVFFRDSHPATLHLAPRERMCAK